MRYFKIIQDGFLIAIGSGGGGEEIAEETYNALKTKFTEKPVAPDGFRYRLRADTLEWELVKLPPIDPEPLTDEEALTRYANTITGASDQTLIEAAETLITERIKEE